MSAVGRPRGLLVLAFEPELVRYPPGQRLAFEQLHLVLKIIFSRCLGKLRRDGNESAHELVVGEVAGMRINGAGVVVRRRDRLFGDLQRVSDAAIGEVGQADVHA